MEIEKIQQAAACIKEEITEVPKIGLILGSGLGVLADEIQNPVKIAYRDIPNFPESTVQGHASQLVYGTIQNQVVLAMQGRFHFYEGYDLDEVVFPVRVMKELGIETLIVTNAAGGINTEFEPGDLMLITDHINLTGNNPLIGPNDSYLGERFPDMTEAYCENLRLIAKRIASRLNITLKEGVYVWTTGPSYETPAEIRMMRTLSGDAVGMSTVPEVVIARHANMKVLGLSCISNMAAGVSEQSLTHHEVIETTEKVRDNFLLLVKEMISSLKK